MEKTELQKAADKAGGDALHKFQKQYPSIAGGDLQTFVLGWQAAEEYFLPIIEQYKTICGMADVPKILIEHPNMLNFKHMPTSEDIEWAKNEIEKLKKNEKI